MGAPQPRPWRLVRVPLTPPRPFPLLATYRPSGKRRVRSTPPITPAGSPSEGASGKPPRRKETWQETIRFWVIAILVILFLRAFIIEPYRIPTPSMEQTLLVGDFLLVSKLHYGARTPATVGIPFTPVYLPGVRLPQTRLPGFSSVQRGDVAVFNYPPDQGPVERRTPYIKRLVGAPGDELVLLDKMLYVNGERATPPRGLMMHYRVEPADGQMLSPGALRGAGYELAGQVADPRPAFLVNATPERAQELPNVPGVGRVEPFVLPEGSYTRNMYPAGWGFNRDNYGPIVVPGEGTTVELNERTWAAFGPVITRYEGRTAEALPDGTYLIDGQPATEYTFTQDYFFAMGDNRDNSEDSRFWGLVPADHMVGKAVLVLFSVDLENRILGILPTPRLRGFSPIR